VTQGLRARLDGSSDRQEKERLRELKGFMARITLGRLGEPDDIARVALFLASDLSGYIMELIVVDGGYLLS
jgi:NAD(P)-dependent dehydrogenase (short-subunit alcohol dehydrogenase family)